MLQNILECFQRVAHADGTSLQHGCNNVAIKTTTISPIVLTAEVERTIKTRSPEVLWLEIEREAGPLDRLDADPLRHALELALVEAAIRGESTVSVPRAVAEVMLADLLAQQRGQARRPKNRPKRDWWGRRWVETAVEQFKQTRRELMGGGLSRESATNEAAEKIAPDYHVSPSTLIDWSEHPGRRRAK
jgi:hypothetical protein